MSTLPDPPYGLRTLVMNAARALAEHRDTASITALAEFLRKNPDREDEALVIMRETMASQAVKPKP